VKLKSEGAGEREAAGLELSRNIVNQHTVLATPSQSLLAVLYMMLPLPEHGCVRPCFRTIKSVPFIPPNRYVGSYSIPESLSDRIGTDQQLLFPAHISKIFHIRPNFHQNYLLLVLGWIFHDVSTTGPSK